MKKQSETTVAFERDSRHMQSEPLMESAPGWGMRIRLADGRFHELKSTALEPTAVHEADGKRVWKGLGDGPGAKLTVTMTRTRCEPGASWRLDVENQGDAALWEVTFPDFQTSICADDTVLLPTISGRLHPASEPLAYKSKDCGHYPSGLLSMQCSGLYGPSGGVYIGVHDPFASSKRLAIDCAEGQFSLRWTWPVSDMGVPGKGWTMPGDVLIRPFEGDWFDIARIYRSWASEKAGWWPRGEQAGRPDTPDWFKDNPVWIMSNGPWPYRNPPLPIDEAAAGIKKFAEFMGDIPCAVHWYNWHQIPYDTNYPHYFPAKDGFAEAIRDVQAAGVRVMPYINAHIWDMNAEDFEDEARSAAVKSENGDIPTEGYAGNTFAPMCPSTPLWRKTVKDLILKLAGPGYGVDGVYLDQVSAQAAMQCFDEDHEHPRGGGDWWTTMGYWPMLDDIRRSSPGTILTSESSAESYINRLDGHLTWGGFRDGTSAVPLFHAVYAGQVQIFGRLYKWDSWKGEAMRAKTAQALVWGEQLGWIIPDVVDDPVDGPFLKQLAQVRYALRAYLARGRMARPPKIETDGTTLTSNWVFTSDLEVTTPTLFSGAWLREDGKAVALILVNADDKPHTVTVSFDAADHELTGDLQVREWTASETSIVQASICSGVSIWHREFTVSPLTAKTIEIGEQGTL